MPADSGSHTNVCALHCYQVTITLIRVVPVYNIQQQCVNYEKAMQYVDAARNTAFDRLTDGPAEDVTAFLLRLFVCVQSGRASSPQRQVDVRSSFKQAVIGILDMVGVLYDSTRRAAFWDDVGHLCLGMVPGHKKTVPRHYKRALMHETRNLTGRGIRHSGQLYVGMQMAKRKAPSRLLSAAQRKKLRLAARRQHQRPGDAPIDDEAVGGMARHIQSDTENFEQYNYMLDSRTCI